MAESLRRAAGSLLMVGLGGTEITELERAWLRLLRPAGIILFRRNIADARQTRELLSAASSVSANHCLRAVDVEGGAVDRLRDALAPMPSAQAVAHTRQMKLSRLQGELIGRAVRAFGFNTTLAPVLDLGLRESVAVMGTRCASATADGVIAYVLSFLAGLSKQGIVGCGKHFPGLGAGSLDSHHGTTKIERDWNDLWREDMKPYRELCNEIPIVMVNHAIYPETKDRKRPASVSKFWIQKVLRKRIGYRGLILSDDLEMGGVLNCITIEEAAVEAVRAGTDIIEICHRPELIFRAYESLIAEAERSAAFRSVLLARARESARKRERLYAKPVAPPLSQKQFNSLREQINRLCAKVNAAEENA